MKMKLTIKVLLSVTAVFLVVLLLGASGLVETSIPGPISQKRYIWVVSVFLYWGFSCSIAVAVAAILGKKWKEVSVAAVSLIITLVVTDWVIQTYRLFPEQTMLKLRGVGSPELHHRYPPNSKMYAGRFEGQPVFVETNEDGLRSGYSRKAFLEFKDRILVLGDSYTMGFGVPERSAFPKVIEKNLRDRLNRDDIAVLNAGILSYSPFLSSIQFDKQLAGYKPTAVMLVLDATDFGDDVKYEDEATVVGNEVRFDLKQISDEKFRNSETYYGALFQLCRPYLSNPYWWFTGKDPRSGYRYYEFHLQIGGFTETNHFFIYRYPLKLTRPYLMRTLEHVNRCALGAQPLGATFTLVVTPRYHHWNTKECPGNWEIESYALEGPYHYEYFRFFDEVRADVNYHVFNMLPPFQATDEFPLVFPDDPHWNERGHAFVGRVLTDYLIEENLIK